MKTKQITKNFCIILMLMVFVLSVFTFAGCKKEYEPKTLTIEQAKQLVNDAIEKAKNAKNIYAVDEEGEFAFANNEGYYEEYFEEVEIGEESKKITVKEWRVHNDSNWEIISVKYLENEPVNYEILGSGSTATSYIELIISDIDWIPDCFDDEEISVSAKQMSEDMIRIIFYDGDDSYEVEIVDGYITKTTETYVYDEEIESWSYMYSYNVTDREIPEIPENPTV